LTLVAKTSASQRRAAPEEVCTFKFRLSAIVRITKKTQKTTT